MQEATEHRSKARKSKDLQAMAASPKPWQDRILGLQRIAAKDLQVHPMNWRLHPAGQQEALLGTLAEVGIASALLVYRSEQHGCMMIIDGHLRHSLDSHADWPCLVLDVNDQEALLLLATIDPLAELATAHAGMLDEVLQQLDVQHEALQALLENLGRSHAERIPTLPIPAYDEKIVDKVGYHDCPNCGHRWPK